MLYANQPQAKQRKTAIAIGSALLLMAALAGVAIPALGTLTASLGLIGIFILDIVVSIGIYTYHEKAKPILAKTTALLRLFYTAILGVGIYYHILGDVPIFNKIWGIGLIVFGVHLIALGILFDNENGKKWVNMVMKSMLIIAGVGYMVQHLGALLAPNSAEFSQWMESIFITPMILGEVFYAIWMLAKGAK